MNEFLNILNEVWVNGLLGVSITQIIVAISILLVSFLSRAFFIRRILKFLEKLTDNTDSNIDDVVLKSLERPLGYVPIVIGLYVLTVYLPMSGNLGEFGSNLVKALVAFTIFSALMNTVKPLFGVLSSTTWLTASMSMWLERAVRMILGIICLAIILDIFGIAIGPLVAGLGLFSVAVALGAQDLFKNLIAGILIIGENRFQPGDRIEVVGEMHGMVEQIGFRSTTVRLFNTAPMVIPNKDLSDVKVINHGEMVYRRLNWTINLIYSTTVEQLAKICHDIEVYMNDSKDIAVNPGQQALARAVEFGASSIDVQILCYTTPVGFTEFATIKQNLIYEIMRIVRECGSDFAFPSTSLYVESNPESIANEIPESMNAN
jgi:MscS family membrane protein|tara:strand:+ start:3290 stop:4414 length:1125 start_codon:yes stop_codon:yes gene_type:complete